MLVFAFISMHLASHRMKHFGVMSIFLSILCGIGVCCVMKILITEMAHASCNEPFFMSRIRGTIKFFSAKFDLVDVLLPMDCESRQLVEMYMHAREIVNIVACEGLERVERIEPYSQWQRRIQRAGFRPKPLHFSIVSSIKSMLGSYNKHFGIGEDGCWFLMGWKNEILLAMSVWEPVSTQHMAFD
jgi:hypothetical protein